MWIEKKNKTTNKLHFLKMKNTLTPIEMFFASIKFDIFQITK